MKTKLQHTSDVAPGVDMSANLVAGLDLTAGMDWRLGRNSPEPRPRRLISVAVSLMLSILVRSAIMHLDISNGK